MSDIHLDDQEIDKNKSKGKRSATREGKEIENKSYNWVAFCFRPYAKDTRTLQSLDHTSKF